VTVADDEPDAREMTLRWRRAVTETKAVLEMASATWAQHSCPGTSECCQLATTKREPWLWPSEWKVVQERLARDRRPIPPPRADGGCPLLDPAGKRCTIYESRPFGCRTFFCHRITGPAQQPSQKTNELLERIAKTNIAADPEAEPRCLTDWLSSGA
jgi:uncharacterized protein